MKKLFITLLILFWAGSCFGATYYMRADGTAANKAAATGPGTDASACMNVTVHNGETFSASDIIKLADDGGDYTVKFIMPSSGSGVGTEITYEAETGDTPVIDGKDTLDYCIDASSRSHLIFSNITIKDATTRNMWADSIGSNFQLSNITSTGGLVGIWLRDADDSTLSNIVVTGFSGDYGLATTSVSSNITMSNISISGTGAEGVQINSVTNVTVSDITVTGTTDKGLYIRACAGNIDVSNVTVDTSTGVGCRLYEIASGLLALYDSTFSNNSGEGIIAVNVVVSSGSYIRNCVSNNNNASGIRLDVATNLDLDNNTSYNNGSSGIIMENSTNTDCTNNIIYNNSGDGIYYSGASTTSNCTKNEVYGNGSGSQPDTTGDGITAHSTCSNLYIHSNLIYNNENTGVAMINQSSGIIANNVIYNNGVTGAERGGIFVASMTGGDGWIIKNNICESNFPYEVYLDASGLTYTTMDYNCYLEQNAAKFATVDGASSDLTWATYHVSYESNSLNSDPLLTAAYKIPTTSPAYQTGTFITGFHDTIYGDQDYFGNPMFSPYSIGAHQGDIQSGFGNIYR